MFFQLSWTSNNKSWQMKRRLTKLRTDTSLRKNVQHREILKLTTALLSLTFSLNITDCDSIEGKGSVQNNFTIVDADLSRLTALLVS